MRLHLDTSNSAGSAEAITAGGSSPAVAKPGSGLNTTGNGAAQTSDAGSRDSVAVSGASNALATSFSDRAARLGQLTAAVQAGTYQVSSAALSQSIVASATV
jgi:anti-sigma28 factor (negative regulator of flagellin synthesis)